MAATLATLIPVFAVIALGAVLRHSLFPERAMWDACERMTYFVLFPALLFTTTATADLRGAPVGGIGLALAGTILTLTIMLLAAKPLIMRAFDLSGPSYTSVFQGALRWNTYVGLAIASSLLGAIGLALVSVAIVAMVPLLNFLCVLVLAWYAADKPPDARTVLNQMLRNPLIWSVLAGLAWSLAGLPLPRLAVEFGQILGRGALALGLLAVGAGLELEKALRAGGAVVFATVVKLIVMPALAIAIGYALGLSGPALAVVAIASSVPSAPGSYVLARQMGGDAPLIASILTVGTVLAAVTIPLAVAAAVYLAP